MSIASTSQITGIQIGRWMALSLALHLVLLTPWTYTPRLTGQRQTVLSVSLMSEAEQPRPARVSPHRQPRQAVTSHPDDMRPFLESTNTASIGHTHADSPSTSPNTSSTAGNASDGSGQDSSASRARIRARLLDDLSHHFDYPLVARVRGWQGTVLLGLRVESDGRLDRIRVERSSGYAVLDRSALNSLNRLGYLTEAVVWLHGRSVDMQLPVIYRLVEN